MPDARIQRDIPGIGRTGDIIVTTDDGRAFLGRTLTDDEMEGLRRHRASLTLFKAAIPWLDGPTSPKPPERANAFLRLVREDTYQGGEPYTDWELLVDIRGIPVCPGSPGQPHAQKGDILREEGDDDLTPFLLRREGREVASPEWWQVRHLFAGLRGEPADPQPSGDGADQGAAALFARYRALASTTGPGVVFHAEAAVPGTRIRPGDFVLLLRAGTERKVEASGPAIVSRVPRAQLAAADGGMEDGRLRPIHTSKIGAWAPETVVRVCRTKLAKPQRPNWKDSTSPLIIVRPLVATVSAPIQATSDEAALFELLHQVGGRMPTGGADA